MWLLYSCVGDEYNHRHVLPPRLINLTCFSIFDSDSLKKIYRYNWSPLWMHEFFLNSFPLSSTLEVTTILRLFHVFFLYVFILLLCVCMYICCVFVNTETIHIVCIFMCIYLYVNVIILYMFVYIYKVYYFEDFRV